MTKQMYVPNSHQADTSKKAFNQFARTGGHPHQINPDRPQQMGVILLQFDSSGTLIHKEGEVLKFDARGSTESKFLTKPIIKAGIGKAVPVEPLLIQ